MSLFVDKKCRRCWLYVAFGFDVEALHGRYPEYTLDLCSLLPLIVMWHHLPSAVPSFPVVSIFVAVWFSVQIDVPPGWNRFSCDSRVLKAEWVCKCSKCLL